MIKVYADGVAMDALAEFESDVSLEKKQDIILECTFTALTAVIAYDGDNAEISLYVRKAMSKNSSLEHFGHGTARGDEITVDQGDEDAVESAYAVAEGINKYLQENGMVEECSELDSEMQGVLFEVKGDDEIKAKIVEGKNRPELISTALFCVTRTDKNYVEELLNYFSMENPSVENTEEDANGGDSSEKFKMMTEADRLAREKVEAEEKKKAEEAQKAEEERKARKKAEAEAAEAKRKREMAEWEQLVEKIKSDRKKEEQDRTEQIKRETLDQRERLLRIKDDKIASCEKEIIDLKQQIEDDRRKLEGLGFFKFSRKKELKLAIENKASKIKAKENSKADIQKEFQGDMDAAESSEVSKLKVLSEELEKRYVIPNGLEEKIQREKKESEDKYLKKAILDALSECGPATVSEIMYHDANLGQYTTSRIGALLRQLIYDEGKVKKTVVDKKNYFWLA